MINTMTEVQERFNKIKDHKPKASKKLNELGEILASAYRIDANVANEMWEYLVSLNVSGNTSNAKFYVAQIFNKLTFFLEPEEATEFLMLNPERVRLLILHGYDGNTMWHCLDTLLKSFLKIGNIDNCTTIIKLYFEKFECQSFAPEYPLRAVQESIRCADDLCQCESQYKEFVAEFMQRLLEINDERINAYVRISAFILGYNDSSDVEELSSLAYKYKFGSQFLELLWRNREMISPECFADSWLSYIMVNGETPYPDLLGELEDLRKKGNLDGSQYEDSKMQFFVSIIEDNDEILPYYFDSINYFEEYIIHAWIVDSDWDRFVRYISQSILNVRESIYSRSRVERILSRYFDDYFDDYESVDDFGRSTKVITDKNLVEFESALASISVVTLGSPLHDEFHDSIKSFMMKASGNMDALKTVGFSEIIDERSPEQQLKDYIHDFLQSGRIVHDDSNFEYRRICRAIAEENSSNRNNAEEITIDVTDIMVNSLTKAIIDKCISEGLISENDGRELLIRASEENASNHNEKQDTDLQVDPQVERDYACALDNEFAAFYFLHSPSEQNKRTDLLSACIKKNDYDRAIALIDMMASTHNNDGYNDLNGWGRQNMLTMMYLIREFDYAKSDNSRSEGITDEMRQVVKQLVDRIWTYLPSKSRLELSGELYRIAPEEDDFDKYIKQLLEDVDIYCSFAKPRTKGKDINLISNEIFASFERLSQNNRLDVIEQILIKFSSVRERLKPVTYDTWMSEMVRSLEDDDVLSIYQNRPKLFETWLESKTVREFNIYQAAQKIGNVGSRSVFMAFRNMVFSKRGFIEGFDYAFNATSENTETKLLHEGDAAKIELDYLDVAYCTSISSISIYLLIEKKMQELSSVRVSFCKINDIEADSLGFLTTFDNGKPSMGWNIYGRHSQKELTVYSDFFEANDIHHIYKIEFQLTMMDSIGELIELASPIVLEYEASSGEYKPARKEECQ